MGRSPADALNATTDALTVLGERVRARRKSLGLSAQATAESAGLSRITLHRIEKGEPSVSIGAVFNVLAVLGMKPLSMVRDELDVGPATREEWIPVRIRLDAYPQLRALAWHVQGTDTLSPVEALAIYERNARHLDEDSLTAAERDLIQALRTGLGPSPSDV